MAVARMARAGDAVDPRLDPRRPVGAQLFLRLPGGVEICCRNDLASRATYVIAEQEDWFEPELAFLRRWVSPGMRALDVGAGPGVYALTLARAVGPDGEVLALEPCAAAQSLLERGIARNGLTRCRLVRAAVADRSGRAPLLARGRDDAATADGASPGAVPLTTLDAEWRGLGEPPLDLVRIEADGLEPAVLDGAARLLAATSPLLVIAIAGERRRLDSLRPRLECHGYALYRLLPGPGLLVPLGAEAISAFQRTILACKPDRAAALAAAGLLLPCLGEPVAAEADEALDGLATLPCWSGTAPEPLRQRLRGADERIARSIAHGLRSRVGTAGRGIADRRLVARMPLGDDADGLLVAALSGLARCAAEIGWRERALGAVGELQMALDRGGDGGELPLLPATAAFDAMPPGALRGEWLRVMAADALVTLHSHSTRFTRGEALAVLERWRHSRWFAAGLERRRQLLRIRLGLQAGLWASEPLRRAPSLNPELLQG